MPIFNDHQRAIARNQYLRYVHNIDIDVEVAITRTRAVVMPGYTATQSEETQDTNLFSGFRCSVYDMLSGKLGRIFRNRIYEVAMEMGIWDDVAYMVQYVDQQYILESHAGAATNGTPSNTILEDGLVDFTTLPIRPDLPDGTIGARVYNTADGSYASIVSISASQIITSGLAGGTDNLFTSGDTYEIRSVNDLQVGDRIHVYNDWREVLAVIKDSEGIQHTALTADG